jgi:hypothetical protein
MIIQHPLPAEPTTHEPTAGMAPSGYTDSDDDAVGADATPKS